MTAAHEMGEREPEHEFDTVELERAIVAALPSASGLVPGQVVGDFELARFLAAGGMGEVWEARQRSLGGRRVALKFLRESGGERELAAFDREARAGGRLTHPGLVAVHAHGESAGRCWIAMELVEGGRTLRDWIRERREPSALPSAHDREAAELVASIADAVGALHAAGVIHRDLKPANVLLTGEDRPKVSDFGIARLVDETALTRTHEVAGTYAYMSPEQIAAKRASVDERSDVFSLGVVLYEMLALRRPFEGDTLAQVSHRIEHEDPPPLRTIRSRVPRDLEVIVGKALEKEPRARFASMGDLAADLRRFLRDEPIRAAPPTALQRVRKWVRRHPAASAVASVAGVAFVVISALLAAVLRSNRALEQKTQEAESSRDDVLSLSALQELEDLEAEADALWPPVPERIAADEAWIARANALRSTLPRFEERRARIRARALPQSDAERQAERAGFPRAAELEQLRARLRSARAVLDRRRGGSPVHLPIVDWSEHPEPAPLLVSLSEPLVSSRRKQWGEEAYGLVLARKAVERANDDQRAVALRCLARAHFAVGNDEEALSAAEGALEAAPADAQDAFGAFLDELRGMVEDSESRRGLLAAERELTDLEEQIAKLELEAADRRVWHFPSDDSTLRWWERQLTKFITAAEGLTEPRAGLLAPDAIAPDAGWSVPKRLAFARRLTKEDPLGSRIAGDWASARAEISASPRYGGLDVEARVGLAPLGAEPETGLWEFWHPASGDRPERGADGRLQLTEASALVLVLLPAGRFRMGAQAASPTDWNYDVTAAANEGPVHEVAVSPFFLSKYEMTQGQWLRLTGSNPSRYQDTFVAPTLLHPVEQVSWNDCMRWLARFGLELPSEAQWEYGCRAGTSTPWWSGPRRESLVEKGGVDLADQSAARYDALWPAISDWPQLDDRYLAHAPVDRFEPNPFGLYQVHGNVQEWCLDGFEDTFYARSPREDPLAPLADHIERVARGGDHMSAAWAATSSTRVSTPPDSAGPTVGLRPAMSLRPTDASR